MLTTGAAGGLAGQLVLSLVVLLGLGGGMRSSERRTVQIPAAPAE